MEAFEIKVAVARYFRFKRQAVTVAFEADYHAYDVLILTGTRHAYEIEIKVSFSDLKREPHKWKHARRAQHDSGTGFSADMAATAAYAKRSHQERKFFYAGPARFYFAFPEELWKQDGVRAFVDEHFPGAGVLVVHEDSRNGEGPIDFTQRYFVENVKHAAWRHRYKCDISDCIKMLERQSNTFMSLAETVVEGWNRREFQRLWRKRKQAKA